MTWEFWVQFLVAVGFLLVVFEGVNYVVTLWQTRRHEVVGEDLLARIREMVRGR